MLDYFSQHMESSLEDIFNECGIEADDIIISKELADILGIELPRIESDSEKDSKKKLMKDSEPIKSKVKLEDDIENEEKEDE